MTITVLDTAIALDALLDADEARRADLLRDMLAPMSDQFRYFPGEVDLVRMHEASFGFPLDRALDETRAAVTAFREADVHDRVERALAEGIAAQTAATPGIHVPDLTVLLIPGDPTDAYFRDTLRGFSGNGSATGFLSLTMLPTSENLDRVEAAAVHELNHNLRYAPGGVVWDPSTVTVGEQIVSEGLADAFARQLYGDAGHTPIGRAHLEDDAVLGRVISGLDVTGMQNFTAWVHGDESARRFGAEPVGLPAGAGYAAGTRIVDAYLNETGRTAAEALHVDRAEVIDVALRVLG